MSGNKLQMPKMSLFSKKKTNNFLLDHMIELLLLVIVICLSIAEPVFLTKNNLLNVLRNSAMKGVIAYGMCLVIISGEIDLSVGSQVALSAVIVAWTAKTLEEVFGISLALGAVAGILLALIVGLGIGVFHAWARTACYPEWYVFLGTGRVAGIPVPAIIFLMMFFVFWFLTEKTDLGRKIYAVGGNAEAARLNGISVWRTRLFVMCMVQLMCVLSGVMNSAQVRSATFGFGRGWETQIISSVVIGGTSMLGGIGTVWGTLIGILFTGVISNGMTLLNVNEYMQYVVNGGLMFFAVWFNTYVTKKRN